VHAAYNHGFRVPLLSICDIGAIVQRVLEPIRWAELTALANAAGAGPVVFCTLRLVGDMLAIDVPARALRALEHRAADDDVPTIARTYILSPSAAIPTGVQRVHAAAGVRGRLGAVARALFPPRAEIARIYGLSPTAAAAKVTGAYLLRPFDVLLRRSRFTLGALLRTGPVRQALEQDRRRIRIDAWLASLGRP
jgi:hypothetical protein